MVGAMVTGVPVGLFTAILLSNWRRKVGSFPERLHGAYGGHSIGCLRILGLTVIVPFIRVRLGKSDRQQPFGHDSYSVCHDPANYCEHI